MVGYTHFKRSPAFGSEQDVSQEANPYNFKLPPGYWREVLAPALIELLNLRISMLENKSLTEDNKKTIEEILKKLEVLKNGGYVNKPKRMI